MDVEGWRLLGTLKRAVKKIRFLLSINVNQRKLVSVLTWSSGKRRISFNDRLGLRSLVENVNPNEDLGLGSREIRRTTSHPSEDDIDKRADAFIASFYKQLQYERQISLELRYYRGNSFDSKGEEE